MKKSALAGLVVSFLSFLILISYIQDRFPTDPILEKKEILTPVVRPLEKYSFEKLQVRQGVPSEIVIKEELKKNENFASYLFSYKTDGKTVSGMLNIPSKPGTYPIIEMNRGHVEPENYQTGIGTQPAAEVFVRSGYITIAPDFLGYADSDFLAINNFEHRFSTYTTALDLLASLPNLNSALEQEGVSTIKADPTKVGIWGHSNGGHVSLALLAISQKEYPTALWNPVSKSFPESILQFVEEEPDEGVALKKLVSDFERDYDITKYNPTNYYKNIEAPIELHQGEEDLAVPLAWSNEFYNNMKSMNKSIIYYTYPGDDHSFRKGAWSTVVNRNLEFYRKYLK